MPERQATLKRLARAARRTALRQRVDETLARAALLLPLPLVYALGALTWIKVARPSHDLQQTVLLLGIVPLAVFVGGTLHAWIKARPRHLGALLLDRYHGLDDRVTSALSFQELPQDQRTALMDAAIEDAAAHAGDLMPRRAAPLHFPRELAVAAVLVVALIGVSLLEVRTTRVLPPPDDFHPLVMNPDDIELFRGMAHEMKEKTQDPETLAAVRRFNQLIEDIAHRRLDRREVFKRMEALDRQLLEGTKADRDAREQGLKGIAEELEKADLSKPIAKSLKQKNLADAEKAMRDLAKALKNKSKKPTKAELDKLRQAMKRAARANKSRMERIEKRRRELEKERKSLLKKKQDGGMSQHRRSLLRKKERQLERLDREKKQAQRSQRQLSRLDRELAQAAEDLMRQMGLSAKDLEQGAQDLNRMAKQQMSDKEKEELRRRLQELRELMRQQGKGGQKRLQRLLRFAQRARGQQGQGGGQQGQGQQGQGLKPGGKGGDVLLMKRGGGKSILMPGMGGQQAGAGQMGGQGQGQQGGNGDKPGGGAGKGGNSWGTGHDANLKGDKTHLKGHTKDVTAAAQDTGQGKASSQVIYGAAQRGFVGHGYQKVYTDYHTVAEQVMNHDQIPPGYRFYVRRYFQLIRPRQ